MQGFHLKHFYKICGINILDYVDKNVCSANGAILIRDFSIKQDSRDFSYFMQYR